MEFGRQVSRDAKRLSRVFKVLEKSGRVPWETAPGWKAKKMDLLARYAENKSGSVERRKAAEELADIIRPRVEKILKMKLEAETDPRQREILQRKLKTIEKLLKRRKDRRLEEVLNELDVNILEQVLAKPEE